MDFRLGDDVMSGYYDRLSMYKNAEKDVKNPSLHTSTIVPEYGKNNTIKNRSATVKETRYINLTNTHITVVDNVNNQQLIPLTDTTGISAESMLAGIEYYSNHKTFQIIETYRYKGHIDVETALKVLREKYDREKRLSEKETVLAHELSSYMKEYNNYLDNRHTYNEFIGSLVLDVITHVRLEAFDSKGTVYVDDLGIHLLIGDCRPDFVHKDSINNYLNERNNKIFNVSDKDTVVGSKIYIVDNDDYVGDRWVKLHGSAVKIPKVKDPSKDNGFYCHVLKSDHTTWDVIHHTLKDADDNLFVFKSLEEANSIDSGKLKIKELEVDRVRLENKLALEIEKGRLEKERHEREAVRDARRDEYEERSFNRKERDEDTKDRYSEKSHERKDHYEERSHSRKDTTETIKNVGALIGAGTALYAIYKTVVSK